METLDSEVLKNALGGETAEFTVRASRTCLPGQAVLLIILGLIFSASACAIILAILAPFFLGGKGSVVSLVRLAPLFVMAPLLFLFLLLGIGTLGYGLYRLLAKGSWYVGTPTRLIMLRKNRQRSVGWNEFSGEIDTKKLGEQGAITLTLRSGTMVYGRYGGRSVSRKICLAGIDDSSRIEQIIRKRISAANA